MILISNGGSNIHRAQRPSDTIAVGTVDGVAVLARSGEGWAIKHRALAGCFVSAVTALDDGTLFAATHGVGVAQERRRRHDLGLVQRGPGAFRSLVGARRQAAGPRRGAGRLAAGACLHQRGQGQDVARARRRSAARRASTNGSSRRRRASATSRTSCWTATGCWSASRSARCRCRWISARRSPSWRSIPIRRSATSIASWCIRTGPTASSSPTASSA